MTEYEILGKTPTGIKVAVYHNKAEVAVFNVPAAECQSLVMLETWLKKSVAEKIPIDVPKAVIDAKGRRTLDMG
jgi:hypothetical protein